MNFKSIIFTFSLLGLASCGSSSKTSGAGDDFTVDTLNSGYEYYSDGARIFVGPQPTAEDIKELKSDKDIDVLINLRGKSENRKVKFDPKTEAQSVGISYHQVPFIKKMNPNHKAIVKIESLLKKYSGKNVLVYCTSGNRAAAWYAVHSATNNSMSTSGAMDQAKGMGLNNRKLAGIMRAYLASSGLTSDDVVDEATSEVAEDMSDAMESGKKGAQKVMKKAKAKGDEVEAEVVDDALETDDPMDF